MNDAPVTAVVTSLSALSGWEVVAALCGVIYIILAARETFWCWPVAFVSDLIFAVLFWKGELPMQSLLNLYYMGMAVYGFQLWRKHGNSSDDLKISSWGWKKQLVFLSSALLLSIMTGYYVSTYTTTRLPYLDAAVMVFAVMNTWLVAQKILQNWIYWLFIDASAITLYWQTGFHVTILMLLVYMVLAVYGYLVWRKHLLQSRLAI